MEQRKIIHVPPTPGRAPFFFGAWLALFVVVYVPAIFYDALGGPFTAFWPVIGLGVLPAVFSWYAFGSRIYESIGGGAAAKYVDVVTPSGCRYWFISHPELPYGAVVETAGGTGTELGEGRLLCCDPLEPHPLRRPAMLLQYGAWAALVWYVVKSSHSNFYLLPAAFFAILICFLWLLLDSPWYSIDVAKEGCFLDLNAAPRGRTALRLRITHAAPDEDGLSLSFEDGGTRRVIFPRGSLSAAVQQTMALDLLRHGGVSISSPSGEDKS
ncbi:MAG: hypothetical protein U0441_07155 [Polyangiaceae bacterium]